MILFQMVLFISWPLPLTNITNQWSDLLHYLFPLFTIPSINQNPQQQEERTEHKANILQEIQQQEARTEHETNIPQLQLEERTERSILHLPSEPEQLLKLPLRNSSKTGTKENIRDVTDQPPRLRSPFPSPSGAGHPPKHLTLDQIYTNLFVLPDMAKYDFTENRRKNLEIYTRSGGKNETPRGPKDILNNGNKKNFDRRSSRNRKDSAVQTFSETGHLTSIP